MTILARLKLELNNQQLLTDLEFTTLLAENTLVATETYNKALHQKNLLYTVIDILEVMANNTDAYRKIATEFLTTDSALDNINTRIASIKARIYEINSAEKESIVSMLFFN